MTEHLESLGDKWFPLVADPSMMPGVVGMVVTNGGTRPPWCIQEGNVETMLLAWPQDSLLRASVIVRGESGEEMTPVTVLPFMEGLANDLTVEEAFAWANGVTGEVLIQPDDKGAPLWFYDPLFFRDNKGDLTPGVSHTFLISGLCYGIRKALLDDMIILQGPQYEAYAAHWLKENPDKTRLDVPPLKINLRGTSILGPSGNRASEYQARCRINQVETFTFGPEGFQEKVYRFDTVLGAEEAPLRIMMYAADSICTKEYVPAPGDEVDLIFWMQGRIADLTPVNPE